MEQKNTITDTSTQKNHPEGVVRNETLSRIIPISINSRGCFNGTEGA